MTEPDCRVTTAELERMVQRIDSEWTVEADAPVRSGRHGTHRLRVETDSGPRRVVLKASVDDEEYCHEARLLTILEANTALPVPSVLGVVRAKTEMGYLSHRPTNSHS